MKVATKELFLEKKALNLIKLSMGIIFLIIIISLFPAVKWDWIEVVYWLSGIAVPIITLASVYLILATFKVQQHQLQIQKQEIKSTQDDVKKQNKTISQQRFEHTYFLLIELQNTKYTKIVEWKPDYFKIIKQNLYREVNKAIEQEMKVDHKTKHE
jgi:ABC-type nickel/cobalt efflux system permease component RcnA